MHRIGLDGLAPLGADQRRGGQVQQLAHQPVPPIVSRAMRSVGVPKATGTH